MNLVGMTVKDLLEAKGKRQIAYVQVTREEEAVAAADAGMDMIGTAFIPERAHFANAVPDTHFQFGLPWGTHGSADEALRDAMKALNAGAQSIYCGMGPKTVEYLAAEGVPVICHLGLVPPKATWTGGYRAVGKTLDHAGSLWRQLKDFESAGAFAAELEVIPANLAREFTKRTRMMTISLGSGGDCDAQYLFSADLLGENRGHIPRHAKVYRNFAAERDRLQNERISAYREYISDVHGGAFPKDGNMVQMAEGELAEFLEQI